jgi:O6-methylguanine-DNA--protein-cysteine methyltransferase
MSSVITKLGKDIQDTQKFVVDRVAQEPAYRSITQGLAKLRNELEQKSLVVQIASQNVTQAHALQRLLETNRLIGNAYQLRVSSLPELPNTRASLPQPALILHSGDAASQRYELIISESQTLGRHPDCKIRLADDLTLVGGHHAELKPIHTLGSVLWQICDRGSRNGTYVNGDRIEDCQTLKPGDRVCLGSSSKTAKSAAFMFESYSQSEPLSFEQNELYRHLFDCNIACLIVDSNRTLSAEEKHFITYTRKVAIAKIFVIASLPGGAISESTRSNLAEIKKWIKGQPNHASIELVSLILVPSAATPGATVSLPHAQPEYEEFCQQLVDLAETKAEEMLVQRITEGLHGQIGAIETVLNNQEARLKERILQDEKELRQVGQDDLKEQIKKAKKKISDEQFFKQVKYEIEQSREELLYKRGVDNLSDKIFRFTKALQPEAVLKQDRCHIRLQVPNKSTSVHNAALKLCRKELQQWAAEEWRRISTLYCDGGLRGLFQRSKETLTLNSNLNSFAPQFHSSESSSVEQILKRPIREPNEDIFETQYEQASLFGYLFKNVRGQVMTGSTAILLVLTAFIPKEYASNQLKAKLVLPLLLIAITSSTIAYRRDRREKQEKKIEELKKKTNSNYESVAEEIADRLVQHLNSTLESEEKQFRSTLETVYEQYDSYLSDREKAQIQLKAQIEEYKKVQQKNIERDREELQKLKRGLSLSGK